MQFEVGDRVRVVKRHDAHDLDWVQVGAEVVIEGISALESDDDPDHHPYKVYFNNEADWLSTEQLEHASAEIPEFEVEVDSEWSSGDRRDVSAVRQMTVGVLCDELALDAERERREQRVADGDDEQLASEPQVYKLQVPEEPAGVDRVRPVGKSTVWSRKGVMWEDPTGFTERWFDLLRRFPEGVEPVPSDFEVSLDYLRRNAHLLDGLEASGVTGSHAAAVVRGVLAKEGSE